MFLVGAGPGDPGLLTLRGAECLRRADVVLYDYLVDPLVLEHCAPAAERVALGHHSAGRSDTPKDVIAKMVAAARAGRIVVRLKGGDPELFARGADEIDALRAAGIDYELVPGVTAATAAAATAEIPLTHHNYASAVALVTGHQRGDKTGPGLDWAELARFPGTLVFYMGVRSAAHWSAALLSTGKSPETPVVIVRRATFGDQRVIRCALRNVAETIEREAIRPPAVIIVGPVAALAPRASWFARRPLAGRSVLVTRPELSGRLRVYGDATSDPLGRGLAELGAIVVAQPAVRLADPPDWRGVDGALAALETYDWIVFSSANGVRALLGRLLETGGDVRRFGRARLAVIGPGTAAELARFSLRPDLVPAEYRAESLVEALAGEASRGRFLLIRASRGRDVLAEGLRAAGAAKVDQVVAYQSLDVERADPAVVEALASGRIEWVTVTSSSAAEWLVRTFGSALRRAKLASLGPVTAETLARLGYPSTVEARPFTIDGLIAAIARNAAELGQQAP